MPKTGVKWINSREKRLFEKSVLGTSLPIALFVALGAYGLAAADEGSIYCEDLIYEVERCLLPDRHYKMPKLGHPNRQTRIARLLRSSMLDELPQLKRIWDGDMHLVGPRSDNPDHRRRQLEAVEAHDFPLYRRWVKSLSGKDGFSSTYANFSHRTNLEAKTEVERFSDEEKLLINGLRRAQNDSDDYIYAGLPYDARILANTAAMVKHNYIAYLSRHV